MTDMDVDLFVSPSLNFGASSTELFDPVVFGHYTLSLWCEHAFVTDSAFIPQSPTKTRVCYQSYLVRSSNGITVPRVPKFTAVLTSDSQRSPVPSPTASPNHASPTSMRNAHARSEFGRSFSAPLMKPDLSSYISPFSQSAQSILVVDSTVHTKSPVPNFIRDAPESLVWHVTMYKDGIQVDPRYESELKSFTWANSTTSWSQTKLSKSQLVSMCQDLSELTNEEANVNDGAEIVSENTPQPAEPNPFRAKNLMSERADYLDSSSSHVISHFRTVHPSPLVPRTNAIDMPRINSSELVYSADSDSDNSSTLSIMDVELESKDHVISDDKKIIDNYQSILPANLLEDQSEFCLVGC